MNSGNYHDLSLEQLGRLDELVQPFASALERGEKPSIEATLDGAPEDMRDILLQELVALEITERGRSGAGPELRTYLQRFPDHTDALREAFEEEDTQPSDETRSTEAPSFVGGYEILGTLGRGGMGVVYSARDPKLNRRVAVKMIASGVAGNTRAQERLLREAQAAAAIRHPNVVAIHAVEEDGDQAFIVLEQVEGCSLADRLKDDAQLPVEEVIRISSAVARGLAAAHQLGIVHRDVKPGNILIESSDGRARLTDFGLAYAAGASGLTQSGEILGTPQYMSPEQVEGRSVDHRSDLFSLGAVMYRMLSGRYAFDGNSAITLARKICDHQPVPLTELRHDVPSQLRKLVTELLEKSPERRIQSAEELVERLSGQEHLRAPGSPHLRWVRVGAVIGLCLLPVLGLYTSGVLQSEPDSPSELNVTMDAVASAAKREQADVTATVPEADSTKATQPMTAEDATGLLVDSGHRYGNLNSSNAVAADMNGDGHPDVVVANGAFRSPQPNQIWINDGHGRFEVSPQEIGNRTSAGLCVGDVNGDGHNDVFFANWSEDKDESARNSLWFNDGTGTLAESEQQFDVGSARRAAFGDVNGDGSLDVWVTNYNEDDALWLNDGNGRFTRSDQKLPSKASSTVTLVDMNGDQSLDAFISGQRHPEIAVWLNDGQGHFHEAGGIDTSVQDFGSAADLNNDGFPDVAVCTPNGLDLYFNDGDGGLSGKIELWRDGRGARKVFLVDINADDVLDIVYGTRSLDAVFVAINDGTGFFDVRSEPLPVQGMTSIAAADFDQDGDTDIWFCVGHKYFPARENQLWLNTLNDHTRERAVE